MKSLSPIRVLVADDHPTVRDAMIDLMDGDPGIQVVAAARDGAEAVQMYQIHLPDIAVLDVHMPDVDGIEALCRLRQVDPAACIILVTADDSDGESARGLAAGAAAWVLKEAAPVELRRAIHAAVARDHGRPSPTP